MKKFGIWTYDMVELGLSSTINPVEHATYCYSQQNWEHRAQRDELKDVQD